MALSKKEQVLAAIATRLATITVANGYNNTLARIDRQHIQLREDAYPQLLINDASETFQYFPDQWAESTLVYTVTGAVQANSGNDGATDLGTVLNALIQDFKKAMYADLLLTALAKYHRLAGIRTDEGFMNPLGLFVARCEVVFRYRATDP